MSFGLEKNSFFFYFCFIVKNRHWFICLMHQYLSYGQLSCEVRWTNRKRRRHWKLQVPLLWNFEGWIPLSEWRCPPGRILCYFSSSWLVCVFVSLFFRNSLVHILFCFMQRFGKKHVELKVLTELMSDAEHFCLW